MGDFTQHFESAPPRTVAAVVALLSAARRLGVTITRTKVAKLLYLADLQAVDEGVTPPSGVEWKWLDHGPYNNCLMFLENDLVRTDIVLREEYYGGYSLRLVKDLSLEFDLSEEDLSFIESVVADLGRLTAGTLKDMSYQTAPMVDAKKRGERGVTLDLSLARRRIPTLVKTSKRMNAVLARLQDQEDDPGVMDDLTAEVAQLALTRQRANAMLLGDD
jgi:uncharacterized phage-associated protein